jgi:type I restriction enzyme S subunit
MKKYNSYKNSGIEWLGEIPKHWSLKRLTNTCETITGFPFKSDNYSNNSSHIKLVRGINVKEGKLGWKDLRHWNAITPSIEKYLLKENDIVVQMDGSKVGKNYALIQEKDLPLLLVQRVTRIRFKKNFFAKYIYYHFASSAFFHWVSIRKSDPMVPHISLKDIDCFSIPCPELKEQTAIARYLDTKTQAIDKKITLLEQKITHYKNLRKSLINEVVTKGLDKTVKLKDSGIDWIGKIPEHWEVKRFKYFAKTIKGKNLETSNKYFENSQPLLSLEYLRNDNVKFDTFCFSNDKSLIATEDDLIIVWDGAATGEILKAKSGYVSSTIAKIDFNKRKFDSRYFYFLKDNIEYMLQNIPTGMGIPHLNPTILNNYPCPYPPLNEQIEIAEFLDRKTTLITSIVTNIETQINTLKELRKTLINDVVTGKINVLNN